jgi:2'-5' RNA ligase
MEGVISFLPVPFYQQVEGIKNQLKNRFEVNETAPPHFSYHVAPTYDMERTLAALDHIAKSMSPFTIQTSGLGIFTGEKQVIYVTVVRSDPLERVHRRIWQEITSYATEPNAYYAMPQWIPHITLVDKQTDKNNTAEIVRWLAERSFSWQMTIDNMVFFRDLEVDDEIYTFRLEN